MRLFARTAAVAATSLILGSIANAQTVGGASLTPYAGYLVTGHWYDGPVGTSLSTSNAPMLGVQGSVPVAHGVSLVGNLAYASGDLRVGLPILGGVNVGTANMWLYDAGVELGGLAGRPTGVAPFVQGGIGGMTSEISNRLLNVHATNVAYTAGVGVDLGLAKGFALRVQAKDWIGRFNSEDAIGFRVQGNLTHNWALSAGVRVGF
jgi:hypothetical protein